MIAKLNLKRITLLTLLMMLSMICQSYAAPTFKGDLRYRNDRTDQDGRDSRLRHRIRGRLGAYGDVQDDISYGFRFVTGSSDPVSANQTLASGASSKQVNLDLVYLNYKPEGKPYSIFAGKYKNQFLSPGKTELIWDGDLTTEGISLNLDFKSLFIKAGYLWFEERSSAPDTVLQGVQIGIKKELGSVQLTVGLSYFDYLAIKGNETLFANDEAAGNSTTTSGSVELYNNDYNLLEAFAEVNLQETALSFFFDYVKNTEASTENKGWLVGLKYGKKLKFNYNYRQIEKDAVVGTFTDSDFLDGGTDGKGHEFGMSYSTSKSSSLSLSHFINKTAVNNGNDYQRTFLDFSVKF